MRRYPLITVMILLSLLLSRKSSVGLNASGVEVSPHSQLAEFQVNGVPELREIRSASLRIDPWGQKSLTPMLVETVDFPNPSARMSNTITIPEPGAADTAKNVTFIGHMGGDTRTVATQGNYAYVGEGPRLTVMDVSNPVTPTVVDKTLPMPGLVGHVAVAGGYAYVAAGNRLRLLAQQARQLGLDRSL